MRRLASLLCLYLLVLPGVLPAHAAIVAPRLTLTASGALISGKQVQLELSGDLTHSGLIIADQDVTLTAQNIANLNGRIAAGQVALLAQNDLVNLGGSIEANDSLLLLAGHDLLIASSTAFAENENGVRAGLASLARVSVRAPNGSLIAQAGNDLTLTAAALQNLGENSTTLLSAGHNLTLNTITEAQSNHIVWDADNHRDDASSRERGTQILTGGDLTLAAGNDLSARAADVTSLSGALTAVAGRDLSITSGQATDFVDESHQSTSSGFLSSSTTTTRDTLDQSLAQGASFSGQSVLLQAGNDLTVRGSQVVSDLGTTLIAGNDLRLEAAQNSRDETHLKIEEESGLLGSGGGMGFMIGSREQGSDQNSTQTYATASVVGAINGDVTLLAGADYTQTGSHVLAPGGDINVLAQNITLQEARETTQSETDTWFKQSGLTVSLSSPILSALQTGSQMVQAAQNTSSTRMQALAAASLGLAAKGAYDSVQAALASKDSLGNKNPLSALAPTLNISLGSSESESHTEQTANTAAGSGLQAGGDINLIATGAGKNSNILIQGSDLAAGHNLTLLADNQINLLAAQNTASEHSTNESSSSSVGVSINLVTGPSLTLGMSQGEGHGDGDATYWTNSHVGAGNNVTMVSGGDMNLIGAVVSGNTVNLDVGSGYGGNLVIQSLQDTETYDSDQESSGFNASIGFDLTHFGGSVSAGQSNITSDYASVNETSGLKAGDGGFSVKVKGDTHLIGSVIASTENAVQENKNSFETGGTLTLTNLENRADYEASGFNVTVGGSFSGKPEGEANPGGGFKPSGNAGMGEDEGHDSSTTEAGISGIAGKEDVRTGDAETGIQNTFDKDKVQKEIDAQIAITQAFNELAPKAAADYAAKQRTSLIEQAKAEIDQDKKDALLDEAKKWAPSGEYNIAMNILIGAIGGGEAGMTSAATKESLAWAAEQMQQATIADSKKFPGICDKEGNCLDNKSGISSGVNGSNFKTPGGRVDLDFICGTGNERCAIEKDAEGKPILDENKKTILAKNDDGTLIFTGGNLNNFLQAHPEARSPLGGWQGQGGQLYPFGDYKPYGLVDYIASGYGGPHDTFNRWLWYDSIGNIRRGMTDTEKFFGEWLNRANVIFVTPFAASTLLPPDVWNVIFTGLKAVK